MSTNYVKKSLLKMKKKKISEKRYHVLNWVEEAILNKISLLVS